MKFRDIVTTAGDYTVRLDPTTAAVRIFDPEGRWCGAGYWDYENQTIFDCPAQLGKTQEESEKVYEALEEALEEALSDRA